MNYQDTLDFKTLITEHEWLDIINPLILERTNKLLIYEIKKFNNIEIYPYNQEHIFRVFNLIKPKDIKVVILGQDPYFSNKDQANGIAFDVYEDVKIPPSLKNIYKELSRSGFRNYGMFGCAKYNSPLDWVNQGVFMLNTSLTVRQKAANSHVHIWKEFTEHVINLINDRCENVIFVAWGKFAEDRLKNIDLIKHQLLTSSHPSPLSATKTDKPFIGSNVFNRINEILKTQKKDIIKW
jgi:uracil-DNA glycosylase